MADIEQHDSVQVFVGVDVDKEAHHAIALDRKGKRLLDSALPNDETKLRVLIGKLKKHGPILLVVDQPATAGALPVAVARDEGVLVAYLPELAMKRIASLHAGEAKTDARDAYIIAEAARSLPHTRRSLKPANSQIVELTMLCGFDEDLAGPDSASQQSHPKPSRADPPRVGARRRSASGRTQSDAVGQPAYQTCSAHGEDLGR